MKKILVCLIGLFLLVSLNACETSQGSVIFHSPDSFSLGESVPITVTLDENEFNLEDIHVTGFFEMSDMNCAEFYVDFEQVEAGTFMTYVDLTMRGDWVGVIDILSPTGETETMIFDFSIEVD